MRFLDGPESAKLVEQVFPELEEYVTPGLGLFEGPPVLEVVVPSPGHVPEELDGGLVGMEVAFVKPFDDALGCKFAGFLDCVLDFFVCHFSPHGFNVDFVIVLDYGYNILILSENVKLFY